MNLYIVRDSKTEAYLPPFPAVNHQTALRMVMDTANDPSTLFHKHPLDFNVFFIGSFDEQTGELQPQHHESLGKVMDIFNSLQTEKVIPLRKATK